MTIREAQAEIESRLMVTRLNVASGLKAFIRGLQTEIAVQELRKMLSDKKTKETVFFRLVELTKQRIDRRYENPWDTALTIYLWAISSVDQTLSLLAAEIVAQAPQCWWAQKLSKQVVNEKQMFTLSSAQPFSITSLPMITPQITVHEVLTSQITLDSMVLSTASNHPIRIHMPTITSDTFQSAVQDTTTWNHGSSAANQDLAAAA